MEEPRHVLADGTKIVTHAWVDGTKGASGMLVHKKHLDARRSLAKGTIRGWVPGHGGDVYWVEHEDKAIAAYGWMDFELAEEEKPEPAGTTYPHFATCCGVMLKTEDDLCRCDATDD